jgi:serine/threonine protein kinase
MLHKIGTGGRGEGYEAEHLRPGRHAALKFLPESVANHAHAMERFDREARAAPTSAPSMKLLEGTNLRDHIAGRPLRLDLLSSNLRRSRCNFIP